MSQEKVQLKLGFRLSRSELVVLLSTITDQMLELNKLISDPKNKAVKKDLEKHSSILQDVFYKIRDFQDSLRRDEN